MTHFITGGPVSPYHFDQHKNILRQGWSKADADFDYTFAAGVHWRASDYFALETGWTVVSFESGVRDVHYQGLHGIGKVPGGSDNQASQGSFEAERTYNGLFLGTCFYLPSTDYRIYLRPGVAYNHHFGKINTSSHSYTSPANEVLSLDYMFRNNFVSPSIELGAQSADKNGFIWGAFLRYTFTGTLYHASYMDRKGQAVIATDKLSRNTSMIDFGFKLGFGSRKSKKRRSKPTYHDLDNSLQRRSH